MLSWVLALQGERKELQQFAQGIIERTRLVVAQATDVLREMNVTPLTPCTAPHIDVMRRLAFNSPSVEEIGYFEGGLLKCTSWGLTSERIEEQAPDFLTVEGISVVASMVPRVTGGKRMVGLQLDNYNVLVDPRRLVDVIVGPGISLALINSSRTVVSVSNSADPTLLEWIFVHPGQGEHQGILYGTAEDERLASIAT